MAKKNPRKKEDAPDIDPQRLDLDFKVTSQFHLTPNHQEILDTIQNPSTNIVMIDGVAGSAKTYISTLAAMHMIKNREKQGLLYIRSLIESASKQMGFLPGDADEKFGPWTLPLLEKLDEIVGLETSNQLFGSGVITCLPVNYMRGLTFKENVVIVDETQNLSKTEITTLLTRFGKNCTMIFCGDSFQKDVKYSGFKWLLSTFNDQESKDQGIFTYKLTANDVCRSKLLRFITKKIYVEEEDES